MTPMRQRGHCEVEFRGGVSVTPEPLPAPFKAAGSYLTARGYRVEWRFTDYERAPAGVAAAGYVHVRDEVPAASIVEDIAWGAEPSTVIVFARAVGDPHAPPLAERTCPARGDETR